MVAAQEVGRAAVELEPGRVVVALELGRAVVELAQVDLTELRNSHKMMLQAHSVGHIVGS